MASRNEYLLNGLIHLLQKAGHELDSTHYGEATGSELMSLVFQAIQIFGKCWFVLNNVTLNVHAYICVLRVLFIVLLVFIHNLRSILPGSSVNDSEVQENSALYS